jgi:predicted DNA-binding ribbon-helix-helix protein
MANFAGKSAKRSVTIARHRTSVSVEEEFWGALRALARAEKRSVASLIGEIDGARGRRGLSAAIRVYVLERARQERRP